MAFLIRMLNFGEKRIKHEAMNITFSESPSLLGIAGTHLYSGIMSVATFIIDSNKRFCDGSIEGWEHGEFDDVPVM